MTERESEGADDHHPFYRIGDMPPPFNVHVVLHAEGREFLGVRLKSQEDGRVRWAEMRGGKPLPLPLHLERALPEIGLWRPQHPDKWLLPLPEPVTPSAVGRMSTERQSFDAVEAAREMEADREAARANSAVAGRHPKRQQEWRNPATITYSPAGQITQREAEGRLMRALAAEEFGTGAGRAGLGFVLAAFMSDADVRALAEHEAKYPATAGIEPFKPLPQDLKDSDTALGWFLAFCAAPGTASASQVLVHASRDFAPSFAAIGRLFERKITGQRVGQMYARAIAEITDIANGKAHAGVAAQVQTIAALRERNRKSKRGERVGA